MVSKQAASGQKKSANSALRSVLTGLAFLCCATSTALAQPSQPVDVPIYYFYAPGSKTTSAQYRLGINVGINGGPGQPYLFDTGSSFFNAEYNPNTWGGAFAKLSTAPTSTVTNGTNVQYCYGNSSPCRGYTGNIVQVPSLGFYGTTQSGVVNNPAASVAGTASVVLSASPGYQVNAVNQHTDGGVTQTFPSYFTTPPQPAPPPDGGLVYGTFGAGDFAGQPTNGTGYVGGSILGQTIVPGATQGYVVAANGQPNPASSVNSPQQANGSQILLGGQRQSVTAATGCNPCVTVGLTPQMLGQFAPVGQPSTTGGAGMVPLTMKPDKAFPNPYGGTTGNNSSTEFGTNIQVSLTPAGGGTPVVTPLGAGALLDSGTGDNTLSKSLNSTTVSAKGKSVDANVTLSAIGVTSTGAPVPGLPTSSAKLTKDASPITYNASFDTGNPGTASTLGLSFFMQNSVLYDLADGFLGYTPFFVTDASIVTPASGPLTVDGTNVPIGLAGVISGPGGVTVNSGGALQLSATNSYTGPTTIAAGGQLLVSGPGSIASSSGVMNNGVFDITRAWQAETIQALTGSGQVFLGSQNLTITNASGTFSGTIADNGSYSGPGGSITYPGTGGSITIAGGTQTLSGVNTYTGGTTISGGALILTGSLASGVTVGSNGSLSNSGTITGGVVNAGTVANSGTIIGTVLNSGAFGNSGTILGSIANTGLLGGNGTFIGNFANGG
ncbi:MAG: hypothetical protein JOY64_31940, partial [Alphaproteobacteria bacterium]|nr:hypothetical protein [Alphaproteobacteria bacterium]